MLLISRPVLRDSFLNSAFEPLEEAQTSALVPVSAAAKMVQRSCVGGQHKNQWLQLTEPWPRGQQEMDRIQKLVWMAKQGSCWDAESDGKDILAYLLINNKIKVCEVQVENVCV